jgi:hypothetical protein
MKIVFDKVYDGGKHIATIRYGELIVIGKWSKDVSEYLHSVADKLGLKLNYY